MTIVSSTFTGNDGDRWRGRRRGCGRDRRTGRRLRRGRADLRQRDRGRLDLHRQPGHRRDRRRWRRRERRRPGGSSPGGALYVSGQLSASHDLFTLNEAIGGAGGDGGTGSAGGAGGLAEGGADRRPEFAAHLPVYPAVPHVHDRLLHVPSQRVDRRIRRQRGPGRRGRHRRRGRGRRHHLLRRPDHLEQHVPGGFGHRRFGRDRRDRRHGRIRPGGQPGAERHIARDHAAVRGDRRRDRIDRPGRAGPRGRRRRGEFPGDRRNRRPGPGWWDRRDLPGPGG